MTNTRPLIFLGGATGSGKTKLALTLAKLQPRLAILSADSRQIYRLLNVGTAKVGCPGFESTLTGQPEPVWFADGVPQFLIDIAEPNGNFSLADYLSQARRLILACWQSDKVPLVVGGTGLYLQALAEGYQPTVKPDVEWRALGDNLTIAQLQGRVKASGARMATTDWRNKRRLIRALERVAIEPDNASTNSPLTSNTAVYILDHPWETQRDFASAMVRERLAAGLVDETRLLLDSGINKSWLGGLGLSYRLVLAMLDGQWPKNELEPRMIHAFRQLMRRQRGWFRRMTSARHASSEEIIGAIGRAIAAGKSV